MEFLSVDIGGIEVYHTQSGFKQTARSYQFSNPNMWRPGTTMYKVAKERQKKASEIISSLNATGSYTNEYGMRYFAGSSGRMANEAVSGPALETTKRIEEAGGVEAVFGFSGDEWALTLQLMGEEDPEERENTIDELFSAVSDKIAEYTTTVLEAVSNINYSPVPVIVI